MYGHIKLIVFNLSIPCKLQTSFNPFRNKKLPSSLANFKLLSFQCHQFDYTLEVKHGNLRIHPWKRRFLLKTIIFRFHVSFRGPYTFQKKIPILHTLWWLIDFNHDPHFFLSFVEHIRPKWQKLDLHSSAPQGLVIRLSQFRNPIPNQRLDV